MGRPTLSDVARAAGVGVATVDRVINRRARVRPETARKVLEAAEAIGFRAASLMRQRVEEGGAEYRLGFILQKRSAPFYRLLSRALTDATRESQRIHGHPQVEYLDELTPQAVVARLRDLGDRVDAIALVAADHPLVREEVDRLEARGIPVVTLLTDLTASRRAGHVGIDNRMAGRTAAWTIDRLCRRPGEVGILMGSHRYQCQELCEVSFRAYFRESAPDFRIIEDMISLEDPQLAQEATLDLLKRHPGLVGIYVAGGGVEGVIEALRERPEYRGIVTVCNELTEQTRSALMDGTVDLVISHPRDRLAARAIDVMVDALEQRDAAQTIQHLLPFEIHISENI